MTLEQAKQKAILLAEITGEQHAVCDDIEGELFIVTADQYLDQQLWTTR